MKVTVIIPYNKDRGFLQKAINSIMNQSYKGEIEIVNSRSENGVSYNINKGFLKSSGELIRYLCDDDMLTPNSIKDTVEYFKAHPEIDFIHSNAIHINSEGKYMQSVKPRLKDLKFADVLAKNHIHGGTQVYRRSVFERFGFYDEKLWTGEELDFHLKILKGGAKCGYLDKFTYQYRRHAHQKSIGKLSPLKKEDRIEAIKKIRNKHRRS